MGLQRVFGALHAHTRWTAPPHSHTSGGPSPSLPTPGGPHLPNHGLLLPQPHDDDAVGLSDAALGPGGKGAIRLVEYDAVNVLLVTQPAGEAVLVCAAQQCVGEGWCLGKHTQSSSTVLIYGPDPQSSSKGWLAV